MPSSRWWRRTRPLRIGARLLRAVSRAPRLLVRRFLGPRTRLTTFLQTAFRPLRPLWVPGAERTLLQEMLSRRLLPDAVPTGGWRTVCNAVMPAEGWPAVTVSVVTEDSERWLPGLLQSLRRQHYPLARLTLVLMDNGSSDGTVALLRDFQARHGMLFGAVRLLQLPNPGFGVAHNQAAMQTADPFLLVIDSKVELTPQALARVVAMALVDAEDVASWELRQAPYEQLKHYDPVTWETLWSSHACILLRRSTFVALRGYDERLSSCGQDVEFSFRCREAGYRLRYCPPAQVWCHTDVAANALNPAQHVGRIGAGLFLRLRYGAARGILAAMLLAPVALLRRGATGARRRLLGAYARLLRQAPALLSQNAAGRHRPVGVFRRFDYGMVRAGGTEPAAAPPASDHLPLVSVITRTYAGRDWLLRQAGLSVLQQTWPSLEWIVVEDGGDSCAATVTELAEHAPFPVRRLSQPKRGRSPAGNLGLAAATGRWCLFLDDDDLLYADHVETLAGALLANPAVAAAYSLAWEVRCDIDAAKHRIHEDAYLLDSWYLQPFDRAELAWRNYIPIQAILFERYLFEAYGGFWEHLEQLEDWNLWRRYAAHADFLLIPKTTSLFRKPANPERAGARQAALDDAYEQVKAETDAALAVRASASVHRSPPRDDTDAC